MNTENIFELVATSASELSHKFAIVKLDNDTIALGGFSQTDVPFFLNMEFGFIVKAEGFAPITDFLIMPTTEQVEKPFMAKQIPAPAFLDIMLQFKLAMAKQTSVAIALQALMN